MKLTRIISSVLLISLSLLCLMAVKAVGAEAGEMKVNLSEAYVSRTYTTEGNPSSSSSPCFFELTLHL